MIATASSPAKLEFAKSYGADVGISYSDEDWADQVRTIAPSGVDVILDSIGGDVTATGLDLLAPLGRLVVYGAASGELPVLPSRSIFGLKSVIGFGIMAFQNARPDTARSEMTEVAEHVSSGRLRTAVQATLPLTEAAKAHALLEDRDRLGRVLLVP